MKKYKNNLAGVYYITFGLIFAIVSFLRGYEMVQFLYDASAIILIIIGVIKIIIYLPISSFGNRSFILFDGILKVLIGVLMLCVQIGVVSTIIGIILILK